jgi:hypothetical protein
MSGTIRSIPGLLARLASGTLITTKAMASVFLGYEEVAPLAIANNVADPQLKLASAIIILFAGSLLILIVGYIVDSTRPEESPAW